MAGAHAVADRAQNTAERAASSPRLEFLIRAGYVARGVVYAVMGLLALMLSAQKGGKATDPTGTVVTLSGFPFGKFLLLAIAICLGAYSIWGFVRAIFDPLNRGKDARGIVDRLGFVWSGICYAALALFAAQLFAGTGSAGSRDSTQTTITKVLAYPAGQWVAVVIGALAVVIGLYQFVIAYKADFKKDLKVQEMSPSQLDTVILLGRLGFAGRGVVFTLVGWFILQGGLHRDPNKVHGYTGAFLFLLAQPYGHLLVGLVAIGFIALGFHSFASARWMKMMGNRRA